MLSIVIVSRNDTYGAGNLERMLYELRDADCQVVLVDWNSQEPLYQSIEMPWQLRMRHVIVPPEVHRCFPNHEKLNVYSNLGWNLGIREAAGDYILTTSQDIIPDEHIFDRHYDPDSFYRMTRWDLRERPPEDANALWYCENRETDGPHGLQGEPLFTNAAGDFILMHRNAWSTIRGYPEWPLHAMFMDGLVCYEAYLSGLSECILQGYIYHMPHGRPGKDAPRLDYVGHYAPLCEYMLKRKRPIAPNGAGWGLADFPRDRVAVNVTRLQPYPWIAPYQVRQCMDMLGVPR